MVYDTNTFASLEAMVKHLSRLPEVAGIVEYGGRTYSDISPGGDYDLTVIFDNPISKNFSGVHIHVAGIPIDCMLLCVDDFKSKEPASPFYTAHLNCNILYDRNGVINKLIAGIRKSWQKTDIISDSQKSWLRFVTRHTIDKLKDRLFDDELYSRYFITQTAGYAIETYSEFRLLETGKPKNHLLYMKQNDPILYKHFGTLYKTVDLALQFDILKEINAYLVKDIGGMWKKGEVLFHLLPDGQNDESEQEAIAKYLFGGAL